VTESPITLSPARLQELVAAGVRMALAAQNDNAVAIDQFADNRRAEDAGSSHETEEPMITYYKWVGQPKPHNRKFRVYFRPAGDDKKHRDFANLTEALAWAEAQKRFVLKDGHPISEELDKYLQARTGEVEASTIETLRYRLAAVIKDRKHVPAEAFPWAKAWNEHIAHTAKDTQVGVLAALRGFTEHLRKQGMVRGDVLRHIEVKKGKKKRGKVQGRVDEARKLVEVALAAGDPAAVAVVVALSFGTRPGEVVDMKVRDVDAGAAILWVDGTKTDAAKRAANVPPALQPILLKQADGRTGDSLLFLFEAQRKRAAKNPTKARRDFLNRRLAQLCKAAGLPRLTAHALRGMHSSFARERGATAADVVAMLGHRSYATTARHYLAPGVDEARAARDVQGLVFGVPVPMPNDPGTGTAEANETTEKPSDSVRGGGIEPPWLLTASTSS
jgi:integrase